MATPATSTPVNPPAVPPLEPGDHLTREEFERRYDAMPNLKKAELIEGVVHIPSPVRWKQHACTRADLVGWLGIYTASTPGVQAGANGTIRLDLENELQPDVTLIVEPACGGQARLSADDYIEGASELVAEVAASSVSIALDTKLRVCRRNNVCECIVWRVLDQAVDWFVLRRGQYDRLPLGSTGVYQSDAFPGLWLDPSALTRSDMATVLNVVQQGIASSEHVAFVAGLQQARSRRP